MTTLTVSGLHKTYTLRNGLRFTKLRAVQDVDLELSAGRTVALVGQSGSGKSTIAKILAQLERPPPARSPWVAPRSAPAAGPWLATATTSRWSSRTPSPP